MKMSPTWPLIFDVKVTENFRLGWHRTFQNDKLRVSLQWNLRQQTTTFSFRCNSMRSLWHWREPKKDKKSETMKQWKHTELKKKDKKNRKTMKQWKHTELKKDKKT